MVKRSVMLCKSVCGFALLACLMAPGPGGSGGATNLWKITDPVDKEHFAATITSLGAAGTAQTASTAYLVKVKQLNNMNEWIVMASAGDTSTSDTSNPTWGCTLTAPTGGFRVESARVYLREASGNTDLDEVVITFE